MKFKKLLSYVAATAIAASAFAGMAVTASAAKTVTLSDMGLIKIASGTNSIDISEFEKMGSVANGVVSGKEYVYFYGGEYKNSGLHVKYDVTSFDGNATTIQADSRFIAIHPAENCTVTITATGKKISDNITKKTDNDSGYSINYTTDKGILFIGGNSGDTYITGITFTAWGAEDNKPSITLNKSSLSLGKGNTGELTATPKNHNNATVFWESSNEDIATVADGLVTAKSIGTAIITAKITVDETIYSAECMVNVSDAVEGTVNDLTVISNNATFFADEYMTEQNLQSVGLEKNKLYWDGRLFSVSANGYSKKTTITYNNSTYYNCLQVKKSRNLAFKVGSACTIKVYYNYNEGRNITAGTVEKGTNYVTSIKHEEGYDVATITVPESGLVYIGNDSSSDTYVAVIDFIFTPAPEEETKKQYFAFDGEDEVTYNKLYVHAIKGDESAETVHTLSTAVTLNEGSLALMITDIPADVTIDKVELR